MATTKTPRVVHNVVGSRQSGTLWQVDHPLSLAELAAAQGVMPVHNLDDLRGELDLDDGEIDEFVGHLRRWRHDAE